MYDAIVAGGSISGLLAAREIAKNGHSVLVLEEGFEVGSPEHCGGLVSKNALKELRELSKDIKKHVKANLNRVCKKIGCSKNNLILEVKPILDDWRASTAFKIVMIGALSSPDERP